ncbi:MAG: GFA family protein [Hyphomonadaceae bacterium]
MNSITGGCQCGRVRYALHVDRVEKPHVCHCRMCQRATGGVFAALAGCAKQNLEWTKGAPAMFASSNLATRGFCRDCGTPLTFAYNTPEARIYVTIGSLDDPELAGIEIQYGLEIEGQLGRVLSGRGRRGNRRQPGRSGILRLDEEQPGLKSYPDLTWTPPIHPPGLVQS